MRKCVTWLQCYTLFWLTGEEEKNRERALRLKSEEQASLLGITQTESMMHRSLC